MRESSGPGEGAGLGPALAAVIIWGLVPVGTRWFVQTVDPLAFNVIRFGAAALVALPLFLKSAPWRWPRADLLRLLAGAVLAIPAYNIPVALAAKGMSAGTMGLLIATEPVFILVFSKLFGSTGVRLSVVAGAALAFAGVALTTSGGWTGAGAGVDPLSALMVLGGSANWALYSVLCAPLVQRHGGGAMASAILVLGGSGLAAVSIPAMGAHAWPGLVDIAELAAMGLVSAWIGFLLWNKAGAYLPVDRLGLFLYLIPVASLAGGAALLGERPSLEAACGGLLILLGVAVGEGRAARLVRLSTAKP